MAQADGVVANGTGAAVRSDLNGQLAALFTNHSGSTEPGTTYAYQWWADTNANVLKIRNSANNAWITLRELDGTMLIEDGSAASPGLSFASDTNSGLFGGSDTIGFATGGAERLEIGSSEVVFNDPSNDVDFRVESNGNTHMLFVDAGNDAVGIGVSSPGVKLDVDVTNSAFRVKSDTSAAQILITSDDNASAKIEFGDESDNDRGAITYDNPNNALIFQANASERMRIDSSGNLLVGLTSAVGTGTPADLNSTEIGRGIMTLSRDDTAAIDHIRFGKNGSIASSIGTSTTNSLTFKTGTTERMRLHSGGTLSVPTGIELGSGLDGTSANTLDDYEEGTFTATYQSGMSSPTYSDNGGTYIKIGDYVSFTLRIQTTAGTNVGSWARIAGLPFTSGSTARQGGAVFNYFGNLTGSNTQDVHLHISQNSSLLEFYNPDGSQFLGNSGAGIAGRTLHIHGFYYV